MHQLDSIFRPRSIAVIGASQYPGKIGWEIVHNIMEYGFQGKLFPVNPKAEFVHSIKCYKSVLEIPDEIDIAILVIPRNHVLQAVDECGAKKIPGLIVITAGFKEASLEGARLEQELRSKVRSYGMRMVGPNCMGIINTDPAIQLDATFAPELPIRGKIGFVSQSGALGVTILSLSRERNLGFSMFASVGNKTDISSNDLLDYWENDPETQIVLLYLENFGNPRRFLQLARRFTRRKPVLAVKSGRTTAGARAASSHTGAMVTIDVGTDAIFEQCGVLRANTIDELFDYATALASQPLPSDHRIAILTNAGGPGIMATDAGVSLGMQLADYTAETKEALRKIIPAESNPNNPLDLLAGATPEHYRRALKILLEDANVSSVLVISVPPIMVDPVQVAGAVSEVAKEYKKPVLGCFMGVKDILRIIRKTSQSMVPMYAFPESAVRALHGMIRYANIRKKIYEDPYKFPVAIAEAEKALSVAKQEKRKMLTQDEIQLLFRAYGIPLPEVEEARSAAESMSLAQKIGFPLVLKAKMNSKSHKSDFGGVVVDLRNASEVEQAFHEMETRVRAAGLEKDWMGVYLQPMVRGGKEVIMGVTDDPTFGSLLMFGLGGIYVETMKDTIFRAIPVTPADVFEMIQSVKGYPLLNGIRGEPRVDVELIAEVLQRISQMVTDLPVIHELEINPFIITPDRSRSMAVDVRVFLNL